MSIDPEDDDLETADSMWPIIKGLLKHLIFDGRDYLVEGVNLRPRTLSHFLAETDAPIRTCFLGYPDIDIKMKASQLASYVGPPQDWLHRTGSNNVHRYLEVSRSLSQHLRAECWNLGLPFVDTGENFEAALGEAERILALP